HVACPNPPVATLTYTYREATAVLGPLATEKDPNGYDLCARHAERVLPPRGWEVVRLAPQMMPVGQSEDEIMALADSVRESARPAPPTPGPPVLDLVTPRHGHLRVVPNLP
ncbi:MAG: DUF3499 domain-containing protein, partial [Bifidobacteriaceae bacterium]|nr:DUF3499 domain-containing protein [Bifidobacteriaceae bacterium]